MGSAIGSLYGRGSILCDTSSGRVWPEFEPFERMAACLDLGHELHTFVCRVDGSARMTIEVNGERRHYCRRILVGEPEREGSFESQWDAPYSWPVPTFWTIRLTPHHDATIVQIDHHGFERLSAMAADNLQGHEDGWNIKHLEVLRGLVE